MSNKKKKLEDMSMEEIENDKGFQEFLDELESKPICLNCDHCIYIGEGDSICDADYEPVCIIADWEPTDDFWYCNGADYESMYKED